MFRQILEFSSVSYLNKSAFLCVEEGAHVVCFLCLYTIRLSSSVAFAGGCNRCNGCVVNHHCVNGSKLNALFLK